MTYKGSWSDMVLQTAVSKEELTIGGPSQRQRQRERERERLKRRIVHRHVGLFSDAIHLEKNVGQGISICQWTQPSVQTHTRPNQVNTPIQKFSHPTKQQSSIRPIQKFEKVTPFDHDPPSSPQPIQKFQSFGRDNRSGKWG